MKGIFKVFKHDFVRIFKSKMAVLILVGMIFVPGIYAWLNIDSNWDPYENTSNIKIAVVNKDQGVSILKEDIDIGKSLTENLENNSAMDWTITEDEQSARDGVERGDYYGAIILPENFSDQVSTLFDGKEIKKPEFDFYVNNKKNPIAPILVSKAASTLETTLDQSIVEAITYKVADKAKLLNLEEKSEATISRAVTRLNEMKDGVERLRTTLNVISSATDSTANALSAVKKFLPEGAAKLKTATSEGAESIKDSVASLTRINQKVDTNITSILDTAESLSDTINQAIDSLNDDPLASSEKLQKAAKLLETLASVLTHSKEVIHTLHESTGIEALASLETDITGVLQKISELKTLLQAISQQNTVLVGQAKAKSAKINAKVKAISKSYRNNLAPEVKQRLETLSSKLNDFTANATFLDGTIEKSDSALGDTINALRSATAMNSDIDTLLLNLETDIDRISTTLSKVGQSDLYLKLANLLKNSPADIADFISKPIATNQIDVYPIEHYGSRMAPFYTILATWVGCTLLVAILKTDVAKKERVKPYQAFFGRFLLFGTLASLQGLAIGLGDAILGVQILNLPLFLFTIILSSLVFMMIIYSLTLSFGKIGEALVVVIMVVQVAGSGGTFPIELLPDFYQKFQPFMPFYPAMNALRETIGGFYGDFYWTSILILLCHTIIPLFLGLVIRNPIIKLKTSLSKSVEDTDLMV